MSAQGTHLLVSLEPGMSGGFKAGTLREERDRPRRLGGERGSAAHATPALVFKKAA
ncbi:hypothetical protein [Stenotrophomonas mori]|uniref:Uncharacterized protein n=1 Tax=Stenotrophomonas mori TaxID=2871096 RepID=A0ABT0SGB4_9GAMM|nr:hypothetical protein [Stenotrophomonas mori]MCL7714357.1 hypothetical protein [Stenotrophomonas mori]